MGNHTALSSIYFAFLSLAFCLCLRGVICLSRVLSTLEGAGSINELEMLSECMTEQCLSEGEFSYLTENLPPEFVGLGVCVCVCGP